MVSICAGVSGSSAAAERARPFLAVTSVGKPPDRLEAGGAFGLPVRIANKGRAGAWPRLVVRLRREGVSRGLLRRTLKFVRPGFGRRLRPRVVLPATIPAATYAVLACVRRRGGRGRLACRAAGGKLRVEARSGPPVDPPLDPRPGSRSLGDALFPEIGNGGYDARHYEIDLVYDPAANALGPGTATTMTARATHDLSQLSLDFEGLDVDAVSVDGEPAAFERVAPVACSPSPPATSCGPTKLVVDLPDPLRQDREFTVRVDYTGVPKEHVDPDGSIEGWIRACSSATNASTCDGAFVVNQPIGAMTWFPSNNHPVDKARFRTVITAPSNRVAIGIGELASQAGNANGTTTWTWVEDDPTATYLTTATVGAFDLSLSTETTTGQGLPVYTAIDSSCDAAQKLAAGAAIGETPSIIDFFNDYYGPYPFDSTGAVVDRITGVSYALEVQTKPHYARCTSTLRPTVVHELAHQWFGNAVTLATWSDIWFNEGWAQWSDWFHSTPGTATPAVAQGNFQTEYNDGNDDKWKIAPAVLDGDPKNLFETFPTYTRGAMTLEGYREIVGDAKFFEFAKELLTRFRYGNVTTAQVIDLAVEISDFTGAHRTRLADYFEQWLYGETKPQITPQNF